MASMRTVTYNAGAYLVEELQRAGVVAHFHHDGGDIILFDLPSGQSVSIHLIESSIEMYEIRQTLANNSVNNIHTLFILWGDRLLPGDGQVCSAPDWLAALYSLYGDRVYAYDIYGSEIFIFPVHFEGMGYERRVRFGTTVNMRHLACGRINTTAANFTGLWQVAGFHAPAKHERQRTQQAAPKTPEERMQAYYDLLGVDEDDSYEVVRKAYRLLARRYHPDLNKSPQATAKMQQINEAYEQVLAAME
jgi:DnaJ domain